MKTLITVLTENESLGNSNSVATSIHHINSGAVKVNGIVVMDKDTIITFPATIEVGKRRKAEVVK